MSDGSKPPVRSPITGTSRVTLVDTFPTARLRRFYTTELGVDIERFIEGLTRVEVFRCDESGYEFYWPPSTAGDDRFYAQLSRFDWYYDESRWEHRTVADQLGNAASVLDVGCGDGAFLEHVRERWPACRTKGLELNPDALVKASAAGLDVEDCLIQGFATASAASFDVVASFQVIEHLAEPRSFMEAMIAATRPGGLVVVGVPNNDGYVGQTRTILSYGLNLPPHHMGIWRPSTLAGVADRLGLEQIGIELEPLDPSQLERLAFGRISAALGGGKLAGLAWRLGLHHVYKALGARSMLQVPGHTVLGLFRRPGGDPLALTRRPGA